MIWSVALIVFITQLVCCIFVKGKFKKYTPTLIVAGIMSVTVLNGTLGVIDAVALVAETKVSLAFFCRSGMLITPTLHIVLLTL